MGIVVNYDDNAFAIYISDENRPNIESAEGMREYIRSIVTQYNESNVTDFAMCVCGRLAWYPSSVVENMLDMYHRKVQNGKDVDYTKTWLFGYHQIFEKYGLDHFKIWIDECKRSNIVSWISIRVNDVHDTLLPNSVLSPDFFFNNMDLTRGGHKSVGKEYFDGAFDFSKREIYERTLGVIKEACARYDSDGIELDFQREAYCFAPGQESVGRDIMTRFMLEVRKVAKNKKIAVRVPAGIETCFDLGFDICRWAKEGLVDRIVPTSRWSTTDTDLPLDMWRSALSPYDVEIVGGVEILMREHNRQKYFMHTVETALAAVHNIYSSGCDKCYLFNFMHRPGNTSGDELYSDTEEAGRAVLGKNYYDFLKIAGDKKLTSKAYRRHLLSFRDALPFWQRAAYQVPCEVSTELYSSFRIRTGNDSENALLAIGVDGDFDPLSADIFVNTVNVKYVRCAEKITRYTENALYMYEIPRTAIKDINTVEIRAKCEKFTISHIEIRVNGRI